MFRNLFRKQSHQQTSASTQATRVPKDPFANGDSSALNVLIRVPWRHDIQGDNGAYFLDALKKDLRDEKSTVGKERLFHGEIATHSLILPGYQFLTLAPRVRFSRTRNIEADIWHAKAHTNANGFIFAIKIPANVEEYLKKPNQHQNPDWERDRFELASLLRMPHLVENPKKPLLLLVHKEGEDDELDMDRLVNLLGLDKIARPFRPVAYTTSQLETGVLQESLTWLTLSAQFKDNEEASTANMTGFDTDEGSIDTSASVSMEMAQTDGHYVLDYEPTLLGGNPTLQRFQPVQKGTFCPFAKGAKLWGGKLPDEHVPRLRHNVRAKELAETAKLNAGPLGEFVARVHNGEALDGFCLQLPASDYIFYVDRLGEQVKGMLTNLADLDPTGENAMKMGPMDHPHWRFRFAGEDFFVTTFAPCYRQYSSRYAFGAKYGFLLFQPMTSFGRHGLVKDTPASETNWENPSTMRDKARVAFLKNGCPYHVPDTLPYTISEHIVKPAIDDGKSVVRWWEEPAEAKRRPANGKEEAQNARAWLESRGVDEKFFPKVPTW